MRWRVWIATALMMLVSTQAQASDDPLKSPVWAGIAAKYFGTTPFVFDASIVVSVPSTVENQAQVPVTADARALSGVTKLIVVADLNPIQHVLTLTPDGAEPYVAFRLKVEQATPVRAAALAADGVWHVGSVNLDAAGGGCSANAMARKDADWSATVGHSQGRIWREANGMARLKLRVRHPMDTGLAKDGTPAFFIEQTEIKDASGKSLARLELFEPVAEDPIVTLMIHLPATEAAVTVDGRDNNGGIFRATIPAPFKSSGLVGQ
jgi:sulfur-oxidizing protein SoxY